jgi:hypothetical protein
MGSDDKKLDVLLPHAPTEDGEGVSVLRLRDQTVELGEVRPAKEGQPIAGDLIRLKRREQTPLYDVEVLADREEIAAAAPARKGPAKVVSAAYRRNWAALFGEDREAELEAALREGGDEPPN